MGPAGNNLCRGPAQSRPWFIVSSGSGGTPEREVFQHIPPECFIFFSMGVSRPGGGLFFLPLAPPVKRSSPAPHPLWRWRWAKQIPGSRPAHRVRGAGDNPWWIQPCTGLNPGGWEKEKNYLDENLDSEPGPNMGRAEHFPREAVPMVRALAGQLSTQL